MAGWMDFLKNDLLVIILSFGNEDIYFGFR